MNKKELSIIIVTFNSSHIISKCINSFKRSIYDVYIVDNASSDNTISIINEEFKDVTLIKNNKNLGFGKANNIALERINTDYALILNPDAIIRDIDIDNAISILRKNSDIAILGSNTIIDKDFANTEVNNPKEFYYSDFVVGGVMFMSMKNMRKIGFFDEKFFMFAEDSEICDRSIANGYKNAIAYNCFAFHEGAQSSKKTLKILYRRFWHLGWSKTIYKRCRKNYFLFYKSMIRIIFKYFFEAIFYLSILKIEKSITKFGFCFGSLSAILGVKAFDKNGNPRGNFPFTN